MLHVFSAVLAAAPNVHPDYNTPATPWISKALSLLLGVIGFGMILLFFVGLAKAANSVRTGDGNAGVGVGTALSSAVVLAVLSTGTGLLNTWANWFGS